MAETMPLERVLTEYRSGSENGWAEEFAWLWSNHGPRMDMLATSIQETGMQEPVLLGHDGRVWDGHHRLAIADLLGIVEVPVEFAIKEKS